MGIVIHRFVFHNDGVREASERLFSPGQVGLLSGWGVFSTIRVTRGVLFAFERHWARISRDAAALNVPLPGSPEQVRRNLLELVEANRAYDSTLRLAIIRNGGGMWAGPSSGRACDVVALTADSKHWDRGVKLAYVKNGRFTGCPFAGAKTLSWAMNLTWLESAQARGFDEVILLNERGEVAECTSANIYIAKGDRIWTPPLSSGCLPGVTREVLLKECRTADFEIGEKEITPAELEAADDVFITSTTRDLLPVAQVEDRKVGRCEAARSQLERAFAAYVQQYVEERTATAESGHTR